MVKTIHLVRHGHTALIGRVLCGRMPGVNLDKFGCRQMLECAETIMPIPSAIQSSPERRAQQSAAILAWHFGLPVEIVPAFDEIDFGAWTGRTFQELKKDPNWKRWNSHRGASCPPKGESMQSLQRRIVQYLEQLRGDPADGTIIIVSHAEPIRAALLHYANIQIDDFLSISVDPARISTLCFDRAGVHISRINKTVAA
jgi:probable phosphoglycerate mutase